MKKHYLLALSLVALLATSGVAFATNTPDDPGIVKRLVGTKQSEPVRVYKLVRYAARGQNDTSLASNDVVVYDTVSDDGITVNRTTTSADGSVAGIVAMTIQTADTNSTSALDDVGKRNWGYIIVHGPATAAITAGGSAASAGDSWITSTDSGVIAAFQAGSTGRGKVLGNRGGFFYDAPGASDTTAQVFVNLE